MYDQKRVRQTFDGAAETYDEAAFLQHEVCDRLLERLDVVRLQPAYIVDAGCGTGRAIPLLQKRFRKARIIALDIAESMLQKAWRRASFLHRPRLLCADMQAIPLADECVDLVFSSLGLQWCNDPVTAFAEVLRVLKPGGLFVFTTFGPDTLKELRASWRAVDDHVHVNDFIDMHDLGDALLQTGYAEPVMEAEVITVNYSRVDDLMKDLKRIGANIKPRGTHQGLLTPNALRTLRAAYESYRSPAGLPASYEIVYGHAWKATKGKDGPTPEKTNQSLTVRFGM